MRIIGVSELRTHLSRVIRAVQAGEIFMITYRGRPVARLEPIEQLVSPEDRSQADSVNHLSDEIMKNRE